VPRCCHGREEEYEAVRCALRAYPGAHSVSFVLALAPALRSMHTLSATNSLFFDTELLAAEPGTVMRLTLPYVFFENFLTASACMHLMYTALPHFVSVPPAARDMPSAGAPRLAVLDGNVGLPSRPQRDNNLNSRGYTRAALPLTVTGSTPKKK
jgi:hypothetical protein